MKAIGMTRTVKTLALSFLFGCGSMATEAPSSLEKSQPEHENFARNRCGGAAKPVEEVPGGLLLRRSLPGFASMLWPYSELWWSHRVNRDAKGRSDAVSPGVRFVIFCQETSSEEVVRVRMGEITDTVLGLIDALVEAWELRSADTVFDLNRCRLILGNYLYHRPGAVVAHTWDGSEQNGSLVCVLFESFHPISMRMDIPR